MPFINYKDYKIKNRGYYCYFESLQDKHRNDILKTKTKNREQRFLKGWL